MPTTLCTLNLNGIRSAERRGFSKWLAQSKPDHLCLQEMRATIEDVEDHVRAPAGYSTRWLSAAKKGYAGVALYARPSADRYVVGTPFDHCADEGRAIRADFGDLTVISLYVPSGSSSPERLEVKLEFMRHMLGYTKALLREKRAVAICGDFNVAPQAIDLARPKQNVKNSGFLPEERAWFAKVLDQAGRTSCARRIPASKGSTRGGRTAAARERPTSAGGSTTCSRARRSRSA